MAIENKTSGESAQAGLTLGESLYYGQAEAGNAKGAAEIESATEQLRAVTEAGVTSDDSLQGFNYLLKIALGSPHIGGYVSKLHGYSPSEVATSEFKISDDGADFADMDIHNPDNDPKYYRLLAAIQFSAGKISKTLFQQLGHTNDIDFDGLFNEPAADAPLV
ncbi:hypothetical protein K1X76_05010 [bacterium]|nr:hypothetical protein [bacterium]